MRGQHDRCRRHQELVALRRHEPCDTPDGHDALGNAQRPTCRGDLARGPRAGKLVEGRAKIDHMRALGRHEPRARRELRRRFRHRNRHVGVTREVQVGHLLEPGRVGVVRMLVQDRRNAHPRRAEATEGGRAVAVEVHDIGVLVLQHLQEMREGGGVELVTAQIRDVDAELLERVVRQVLPAQTHERCRHARAIEARHHPGEEPFHPVHAGAGPAQVVADVHDVERAHYSHPSARYHAIVLRMPLRKSTFGA